jgi:hypothetical protein
MPALADLIAFECAYLERVPDRSITRREFASYLHGYRNLYRCWPI